MVHLGLAGIPLRDGGKRVKAFDAPVEARAAVTLRVVENIRNSPVRLDKRLRLAFARPEHSDPAYQVFLPVLV
ncbi:MAG: hypothetical protein AVDCRST_MAG12-813 [uncultured Rubrobacteraceae bacterium]|uniref:Uncharacterized protein n=1 Tax=uncultured Rubrobacteraceae bacterium TaxID=349277 RepID=A0A6J4RPB6_9ACTN|nr:MAG: hypothetical protein AVDCRST_MAG12-813 [uncultured Rubrobacteraceae bacterium]